MKPKGRLNRKTEERAHLLAHYYHCALSWCGGDDRRAWEEAKKMFHDPKEYSFPQPKRTRIIDRDFDLQ